MTLFGRRSRSKRSPIGGPTEIEIERNPTPVEIDRTEEAGRENDVNVPLLQSRWASFALACAALALLFAIFAFGKGVLFMVWLVVGIGTFIWWMWRSSCYVYEDEEGREHNAVTILDFFVGCGVTLFTGFLAWCVWRVATLVVPSVHLPDWLIWLGSVWNVVSRPVALVAVLFSLSFYAHVEIAFLQRIIQASVFQQQHLWAAIGRLLGGDLPPWWWQYRQRPAARPLPRQVHITINREGINGAWQELRLKDCPLDDEKMVRLAEHILSGGGFSEPACCSGGAGILTPTEYNTVRDWMFKHGFARWSQEDNHKQGVDITHDGADVLDGLIPMAESATTPPYDDNGGSE